MIADSTAFVWPTLGLAVAGYPDLVRHFVAELGAPETADVASLPDSVLVLMASKVSVVEPIFRTGRHKLTRWHVRLGPPADRPIVCQIRTQGVFGRSLAQSLIIEPLLSVAHAHEGRALMSAAALLVDERVLLLVGGSRSGKSSLAVRAWSRGVPLLADDRVLVAPDGAAIGVHRRLRLYPDVVATAPDAASRLGRSVRVRLRGRGWLRRLSAGWVALPELVPSAGILQESSALPIGRLVIIERRRASESRGSRNLGETHNPEHVWGRLDEILGRDIGWLAGASHEWSIAAQEAQARQLSILRGALQASHVQPSLVSVPSDWPAHVAVERLARHLGLEE